MSAPAATRVRSRDQWADWLLHGRQRGLTEPEQRRAQAALRRIRDRVLRGARLRKGQRVLDLGAGTGLLTCGALRRVGPLGEVVAFDLSHDALCVCREQAQTTEPTVPVPCVAGDAQTLPFRDATFDVVVERSVLMYVADRPAALAEVHRVLRPGGRVSLFEPVNVTSRRFTRNMGLDLSAVQPTYGRVAAYWQKTWQRRKAILGFDERELADLFIQAGFTAVESSCDFQYVTGATMSRASARALLWSRPDPGRLSYEEAARAVLGDDADEHLHRLTAILTTQTVTQVSALVYLTARR